MVPAQRLVSRGRRWEAEERGHHVDRAIYGIRIARLTSASRASDLGRGREPAVVMPEYISRIAPIACPDDVSPRREDERTAPRAELTATLAA